MVVRVLMILRSSLLYGRAAIYKQKKQQQKMAKLVWLAVALSFKAHQWAAYEED